MLTAFGMLSRWRHVSLALACGLLVTVGMNNGMILRDALAFIQASRPPSVPLQSTIDAAVLYRQTTPTPDASVVLKDDQGKVVGTVGPGGSLTVGDSGVMASIWVAHEDAVFLTSDVNWSPSTQQRVGWLWTGFPFVETNNWYFALLHEPLRRESGVSDCTR